MMRIPRLGILGAGQLGKMLCQAASPLSVETTLLDISSDYPAMSLSSRHIIGDFTNQEHVKAIADHCDVATIEIEKVSSDGLRNLIELGVTVHPNPMALDIIKDKGYQKQFYKENGFPSSPFFLAKDKEEIELLLKSEEIELPFVLKSRTGGYDGRGVQIIRHLDDLRELISGPYLIEELIDIQKELALIVARNENDELSFIPMVEMIFDQEANLVDYLFAPASIDKAIIDQATTLGAELIRAFDICGLLSIEFFLDKDGNLLINEVAPRPHNSGHFSIEACTLSQYDLHLRGILNFPLPVVEMKTKVALMLNLLGGSNSGEAKYYGLTEIMKLPGVYVHLYGKKESRYNRKMGHITITDDSLESALNKMRFIKETFKIDG